MDIVRSINDIPIRLTDERWRHIVENHNDMAGYYYEVLETVENPKWLFEGEEDDLWAGKSFSDRKVMLVIYKESQEENDGFIITAFLTTKLKKLLKRKILWQQQ